jgi:hypothetical protein
MYTTGILVTAKAIETEVMLNPVNLGRKKILESLIPLKSFLRNYDSQYVVTTQHNCSSCQTLFPSISIKGTFEDVSLMSLTGVPLPHKRLTDFSRLNVSKTVLSWRSGVRPPRRRALCICCVVQKFLFQCSEELVIRNYSLWKCHWHFSFKAELGPLMGKSGVYIPTFRRNILPPSSRLEYFCFRTATLHYQLYC